MAKNKVIIIGGGASGLMAGIVASKNGAEVTIIEHKDRVGKKILMTGNGKCNLTNVSDFHGKYYSNNIEFVYDILSRFTPLDTCEFFKELGLFTKEKKDGGIYPVSEQAASVLDVLRLHCQILNIKILTETNVEKMDFANRFLFIENDSKKSKISFDKLIIATGGKSASVSGSDGSGYEYAKQLGLKLIKPLPALVQLKCEGNFFKAINGVRAESDLSLYVDEKLVKKEYGELQLTDYGISGYPVFQFSRLAARALDEKKSVKVLIDFLTYMSESQKDNLLVLKEKFSYKSLEEFLNGLVNKKLSLMICKQCGYEPNIKLSQMSDKEYKKIVKMLQAFEVKVKATNSFEQAQVTSGGISLIEINENLMCKKQDNVYFIGEILDCDGICGGYNLQWAWATGYIAGKHAANA